MQNRRVKVVYVHLVLLGAQPHGISRAVGHAAAHAGAGQPHRVAPRVVVAAGALLAHRHAAELATPNHQRVVQYAARFQILQQTGNRQIGSAAVLAVVLQDIFVRVPASGVAGVKLHEAHAFFDHSPGQQAARAKLVRLLLTDAIQPAGCLGFAGDVDDLRRGRLHAKRQLVGVDASGEPVVEVAPGQVFTVEVADQVEHATLATDADTGLRLEIQNRLCSGPQRRALIAARQKTAAPSRRAALEPAARVGQHDERRHVTILRAQAIGRPGTEAGFAHENRAGVHLVHRLRMVHAVAVATAQHANVIRVPGDVREEVADLEAGLAARAKRLDRAKQRIARDFAARHHLAKTARQRLAGVLGQVRLGIEQIHVARPAVHEQPNDTLGPWSEMRLPRC